MLLTGCLVATAPADVVIMKDGFVIQGNVKRENESIRDPATGQSFTVPKANGYDMIDDGPRVIVFSKHHRQLAEITKDIKIRPEYKAYKNPVTNRIGNTKVPTFNVPKDLPDFDEKWRRTVDLQVPGGFLRVVQQVTYLDPYSCFLVSPTHLWGQTFRTSEMDPKKVRKLLSTHPELVEQPGKPEPLKRIAIARFMKDAGWLYMAQQEIEQLKKDAPGEWSKEAKEEFAKFEKEMDAATGELVVDEAELALKAGRYQYATDVLAAFPEKKAARDEVDRYTRLKAQLESTRDAFRDGRRLLRDLIDDVTGTAAARPHLAVGGGPLLAAWPRKKLDAGLAPLVAAAEVVHAELHPDAVDRIDFFVNLARQLERDRSQMKPPSKKPEELLAVAISGWAKGKTGATPTPDQALRIWAARQAVLDYQRAPTINARTDVLLRYQKASPIDVRELVQVISLLPPAEPEDLVFRTGELVSGNGIPGGVYKRKTGSFNLHPAGIEYLVKLPPEYHHGRAYPVLVLLSYPGVDPTVLMSAVANDSEKNGYIVVAPIWFHAFGGTSTWEWKGEDHDFVLGPLRDVIRHFTVDNDRVFLWGAGEGADMAMDVGVSHPDLFAGVIAIGSNPLWRGLFIEYWKNAQKLPFYVVSGEHAHGANQNLRFIFDKWMPHGFPAIKVFYRGRGIEWFPAEVPVIFDWMGRKKRANGTATLQLGNGPRYPWQTIRTGDNRFYWLGAEKIDSGFLADNDTPGRNMVPAQIKGDIRGNTVVVETRGVREVSIWLGADMIDWTKPVRIGLNGRAPNGYRPAVLKPDPQVLLEDYWNRGDRRMLYLARLEFPSLQ